ncbi:Ferrochelatase [Planctomycetes bacterium Pan216]|uniref:Ferrochelatase n=1 Tax=Kolteria novifilia TaxID=2527975 RepID=A0A518B904_9BACT|nr:Ferrochelatase [Planctomycetes bacterium Pan216]
MNNGKTLFPITRGQQKPIDVLLLQLGTPDEPTAKGLRPYLREFLSDPRVVEVSPWLRWLLVNLIIVPFRSPRSAEKYRRIWDDETGSPLLDITRRQTAALGELLGEHYRVQFGMRYGKPSIREAIRNIAEWGGQRIIVVPMYPQYSATTTASGLDGLFDALREERIVPAMRIVQDYYEDPAYIDAVVWRIRKTWEEAEQLGQRPEVSLLSFHGIPHSYVLAGDPYQCQSTKTAHLVARRLGWSDEQWRLTFQSRLGPSEWLQPYTDKTLIALGEQGVKTVLVAQPGFTADCLETIDEIGYEGLEEFRSGGGETLVRVPCVNDDPPFIEALKGIVEREAQGWL